MNTRIKTFIAILCTVVGACGFGTAEASSCQAPAFQEKTPETETRICTASEESQRMDNLDLLLVANRFLSGETDVDMWQNIHSIKEIVNLYDLKGSITAYYVSFNPKGYAIINNNPDNPIAIEFGAGDNAAIRKIIKEKGDQAQICYAGPGYSFDRTNMPSEDEIRSINNTFHTDALYAELAKKNEVEKTLHEERRAYALQSRQIRGGSYDFIDWYSMPSGSYSSNGLPFGTVTWAVMDDYEDIANDHCGATAATNIALYFAYSFNSALKKNGSIYDTFVDLHNRIGNGPAVTIASGLKKYVSSRGFTLNYADVPNFQSFKTSVSKNRPCGILLCAALDNWHWVVGVGYRQYNSGGNYVRVINGWEDSEDNFFLFNDSSAVISITEYRIN